MDRPRFAFRRLDRTLVLVGVSCLLWLFYPLFFLAAAFVLIGMAAEVILKPDYSVPLQLPMTGASDAKEKGRRLKEAVAAGRLYDDPDLTLAVLAVKPAIHPHDLSRIINQGLFGDEPLVGKFCLPDCCFVVDGGGGLTSPVKSLRCE